MSREQNTKFIKSYGFLEKRQISRYNVDIAVFLFQKETKIVRKCFTWNKGGELMRKDFACIVISHGRPECSTVKVLRECGYTGQIYIVVDDEDKTLPDYIERYGNDVHVFHKEEYFDTGDLGGNKGIATFARNECRKVAVKNKVSYYFMLDDDLKSLSYRYNDNGHLRGIKARELDRLFDGICTYFDETPVQCIGFGNAVDYIGGVPTFESGNANRAVMNGYFLRTENIFFWNGRYSEDSITDVMCSRKGQAWFRFTPVMNQFDVWLPKKNQEYTGGCISSYKSEGSFKLRFYATMFYPDCIKIRQTENGFDNSIDTTRAFPKILSGRYKKGRGKNGKQKNEHRLQEGKGLNSV